MSIRLVDVHHSSNVKAVGYDVATHTLAVRFQSGQEYHYHAVSADKYAALVAAESKGGYIAKHIRGHHRATKVGA